MQAVILTQDMIAVLCLLGFTVFLFASEIVRVDLAAIFIMVTLGILSAFTTFQNLADIEHLFDGFASNAVISIIAVMIIGAGLDKTGLMSAIAVSIVKYGGRTEKRIIPIVSGVVGLISSFMQNVGAAALFLPVVSRISARTEIPINRLLMPMGFCAILGGTLTMVGSSPLILLNDLIATVNVNLPADQQIKSFGLFDVTPIGLALVATGILYFMICGRFLLPKNKMESASAQSMKDYMKRVYGIKADICEVRIPEGNLLIGEAIGDIMEAHHIYVIGYYHRGSKIFPPVLSRPIEAPCRLAILGRRKVVAEMVADYGLELLPGLEVFAEDVAPTKSGVAEIVIPPDSNVIGKSARDLLLRQTYGQSLLAIHRGSDVFSHVETEEHESSRVGTIPLQGGDTIVVHTEWGNLTRLNKNPNFVIVTSDYPQEDLRPHKVGWALFFFAIALGLILFSDLRLSLCLLVGALGMILSNVLTVDEAYQSVGWNTVFLLASLIPLGQAVQNTGTAEWIAYQFLTVLDGWPLWSLQAVLAVLATIFTLVMSNVGATVLLVPLAVSIALASGGDPALFALTVAISTSNSFLIPTHQVNALIMTPGGYRVMDFVRTGGGMTVLFLVVSLGVMNLFY